MILDCCSAAYAALWGCDPCYDHFPRIPGDGYLFYNYAAIEQPDRKKNKKFIPAIERTIECVRLKPKCYDPCDEEELQEFLQHVKQRYNFCIANSDTC